MTAAATPPTGGHRHGGTRAASTPAPGAEKPPRFRPKLRYELIGCAINGHELVGTDARAVRPEDSLVVREHDGLRWHRCLRCDSWLPLPPTRARVREPSRRIAPTSTCRCGAARSATATSCASSPSIAPSRSSSSATIAASIFVFAHDRDQLRNDYTRILADLQGGLGGPINNTGHGVFSELNRLFALSTAKLRLAGYLVSAYTVVLAFQAFGLWFGQRWAEYLTVVETGVLVPLEIYELTNRVSALKIVTLILNLAVVAYLLISKRLFGLRGGGKAERAERPGRQRLGGAGTIRPLSRRAERGGAEPAAETWPFCAYLRLRGRPRWRSATLFRLISLVPP